MEIVMTDIKFAYLHIYILKVFINEKYGNLKNKKKKKIFCRLRKK